MASSLFLFLLLQCCALIIDSSSDESLWRIVGGVPADADEFPFMVSLGWKNNDTEDVEYLSGGMLITNNYVLTAAHCVFLDGLLPDVVSIGGNTLGGETNTIRQVKDFFIYPEYEDNQAYFDIALLKLTKGVVQYPVCLWDKMTLPTPNVTAIGYGVTEFAGFRTVKLLKVDLQVYEEKQCQPYFKRQRKFRSGIVSSHICAGDPTMHKDTCQGDSGGPLLMMHKDRGYAIGIISIGQACSGIPPAVYTRISSYTDWIEDILKKDHQSIKNCY